MAWNKLLCAFRFGLAAGMLEGAIKVIYHGLPGGYGGVFFYLLTSGLIYGGLFMMLYFLLFKLMRFEGIMGAAAAAVILIEFSCYYLWHRFQLSLLAGGKGALLFKAAALGTAVVIGLFVYIICRALRLSKGIEGGKPFRAAWMASILIFLALFSFLPVLGRKASGEDQTGDGQTPNLLILTIDTLRADSLGCFGSETISTPVIDRLAGEAVLFTDAVCEMPLTTPSHAAILSSTYPATNKALGNQYLFKKGFPTLAQIFNRRQGYRCAAFVSGFPLDNRFGLSRGFHVYDDRFFRHSGWFRNSLLQLWARFRSGRAIERQAEETTDAALEWIRAKGDQNFFLWVHYFDPHAPYEPPPPFETMYRGALPPRPPATEKEKAGIIRALGGQRAREDGPANLNRPVEQYLGEISYVDHQLGRLFSYLRGAGLWDDLIVVLTSDHGESLTEHDYLFQHGEYLFEPSVKVPLIIRLPSGRKGGVRIGESVQLMDIAPTILALCRMKIPRTFQGQSLMPFIEGREGGRARGPAYIENTDRTPQYKPKKLRAVRTKDWKYIFSPEDGGRALYDLRNDAGEKINLAAEPPPAAAQLEVWMRQWAEVTGGSAGKDKEILMDEETGRKLRELGYVSE